MAFTFSGAYLSPSGLISSTLQDFEQEFVRSISAPSRSSQRRKDIYAHYQAYLADLPTLLPNGVYEHWLDGSFVTDKKDPKDLDFVTFVPADFYQSNEGAIVDFMQKWRKDSKFLLDNYIAADDPVYKGLWERFSWIKCPRTKTIKSDSNGNLLRKGFIQITLNIA